MDSLHHLIWHDGKLLGIDWSVWKVVGMLGNVAFFTRFLVQWYATEKKKRVVVPATFWWLSLGGTLLLLTYSLHKRDSVFIIANLFPWIPYTRNLIIHYRHQRAHLNCSGCGRSCPPQSHYCANCGAQLAPATS
jgi:lipid-A-disaccharide synthase-like uncharacterized protein